MPVRVLPPSLTPEHLISSDAVYTTARTGPADNESFGLISCGQRLSAGVYDLYQAFLAFPAQRIPPWETITATSLAVVANGNFSAQDFAISVYTYDFGTSITTADWRNGTQLAALTKVDTGYSTTSGWTGTVVIADTDPDLAAEISAARAAGRDARFLIGSARQQTGTVPTGDEYVRFDESPVGPTLTVTTTVNITPAGTEYLTIDGVPLTCPAWKTLDLGPLHNVNVRGTDRPLPRAAGSPGAIAYPRRYASTRYVLPVQVYGARDPANVATTPANLRTRLTRNVQYLREVVAAPPPLPQVTRTLTWTRADGSVYTAQGHVEAFEMRADGPTSALLDLELSVPDPAGWTLSGTLVA